MNIKLEGIELKNHKGDYSCIPDIIKVIDYFKDMVDIESTIESINNLFQAVCSTKDIVWLKDQIMDESDNLRVIKEFLINIKKVTDPVKPQKFNQGVTI